MEYALKPISLDKYQRSYLMGCAAGLDAKLKEESDREKKEDEVFGTKVTALIVRNDTAIKDYVANKFGGTKSRKTHEKFDSARNYGYKDGKNTSLNKAVTNSQKQEASKVKLLQ